MKPFDKVRVTLQYQGYEYLEPYKGEVAEYLRPSKMHDHVSWIRFQDGNDYPLSNRNFKPYRATTNEEALLYLEKVKASDSDFD